jgi:hypothetical protein
MSNDVYGAIVILMVVASLVAIRVSRHRVHTDHICFVGFTPAIRRARTLALGLDRGGSVVSVQAGCSRR